MLVVIFDINCKELLLLFIITDVYPIIVSATLGIIIILLILAFPPISTIEIVVFVLVISGNVIVISFDVVSSWNIFFGLLLLKI